MKMKIVLLIPVFALGACASGAVPDRVELPPAEFLAAHERVIFTNQGPETTELVSSDLSTRVNVPAGRSVEVAFRDGTYKISTVTK